jgi:signal transduction histidine kinase
VEDFLSDKEVVETLFHDATAVLKVNLDDDIAYAMHLDNYVKQTYSNVLSDSYTYSKIIAVFIDRQVIPEERPIISAITKIQNVREALRKKDTFSVIYRNTYKDSMMYSIIKFMKVGSGAEPSKVLLLFQNCDDVIQKQLTYQNKLKDARQDAEIAQMSKSAFLFNMSHDLRTPMNAIMGLTDIAKKHINDSTKVYECLEKINFASSNLLSILNDVLDMTRLASGNIKSEASPANIKLVISNLIDMMKTAAEKKNIKIQCDYDSVSHTNLIIDKLHFNQILMNIIDNGIKFGNSDSTLYITVSENNTTDDENAYFTIKIKNTGVGIQPDFLPKIFESFSRERNSTMSGIQGAGLGLSITKKLVELLKGTIEVESQPGKETTFTVKFIFPINKSDKKAKMIDEIKTEIKHNIDLSRFKVLLVEDNELNREIAKDILHDNNIKVVEAENGSVAVNIIEKAVAGEFNAIFMDIQMPVMDGYQATRKIRALKSPVARIPIIALTANAFEEDKKNCFAVGMDDHIAKPVSSKKIIETLKKFC